MEVEKYEELIQIEAEQLAETLFGKPYFDLSLDLRFKVRVRVIEALSFWPVEVMSRNSVAIA